MQELLLSTSKNKEEVDDHDLPFTPGTPFKGVVRSKDFINGTTLASRLGLVEGTAINNDSGWLHFVEDNGYNIYIAKKPLRQQVSWEAINTAQTGKEIVLGGKTFVVEFVTGAKGDGLAANYTNAGGAWNRYIYNVYKGERYTELPASRVEWGIYTGPMLGIPVTTSTSDAPPGTFSWVKETTNSGTGAHVTRGVSYNTSVVPNVMGVWYGNGGDGAQPSHAHYAWRPMLVEKGTTPPLPDTPFKGEVAQASFITTDALATAAGLSAGTNINVGTPWLHLVVDGVEYYVAKTTMRNNISKDQLVAANLVTGNKTVVIGGKTYKVRCMTGRAGANTQTMGGEWLSWYTALTNGTWAEYTTAQLITGTGGNSNGELVHVQENDPRGPAAFNGYPTLLTAGWYGPTSQVHPGIGWRPVLELVP